MNAVELLRQQMKFAHDVLEGTVAGTTPEQAHWHPPGGAHPISALYAHVALGEDFLLNSVARGAAPLYQGEWGAKTGISEPPPSVGEDWSAWAKRVTVDLDAARAYAQAVFANSDAYLASLSDADLDPVIGDEGSPFRMPLGLFLGNIILGHVNNHAGEISTLKGIQGLRGYPF